MQIPAGTVKLSTLLHRCLIPLCIHIRDAIMWKYIDLVNRFSKP